MDDKDRTPAPPSRSPAETPARPSRRWPWVVLLVVLVVALIAWIHHRRETASGSAAAAAGAGTPAPGGPGGPGGPPGRGGRYSMNQAQAVTVAKATSGEMPVTINALGTVTPLATVTVRTQIAGTLTEVAFREGQMVKAGDFLAQVDPRPYQIQLQNAEGTKAKDEALLLQARNDLARYQVLIKQDSISQQQFDDQQYLVKQYEGQVKTDQAAIDTAKLDLVYAHITAPVAGRVGLRQVDPGNYVQTSDTNGVVIITQMQPMSVIFTLAEDNLPAVFEQVSDGAQLSVTAYDRSGTTPIASGHLDTLDNQIDTTTGTLKLRALFDNKKNLLFPNQFVNTKLLVRTVHDAIIVPSSSVQTGSIGQFVYVVKPDDTVTVRVVKVGPIDGERTSIVSGLSIGETVVTDGADRLREGAKVVIPARGPHGASGASGASGAAGADWASGASSAHAHRHHHSSDAQ
ncbi:MdtA/MuxA family multidrug efflux RND transporter periplasmic adaptor subunit [Pararobbsia silviterrae]|uniref:MdtA/MuxA family multidrug efflux RND transporter periplasmic adaptor subunit n=1 Tax=Pararobbsia silviterrae TaxID=1792498 RepID=A0A494XAE9_9BURK|nr:MdtA/MuxA family multidrug efflux RND transporter periplasmic adaptor subunit [Pararobbsia silviterrae]RKP46621.1 MdtA/MuxA family multidrug efflux RND transporter periplasmic adaptor subunit [Pararobbsia silviterrae]